jgi:hypothetical protein
LKIVPNAFFLLVEFLFNLVSLLREHISFLEDFALGGLQFGLTLDLFGVSFIKEFDHAWQSEKLSNFLLEIKTFVKVQLGEGVEALGVKLEQRIEVLLVDVSSVDFKL